MKLLKREICRLIFGNIGLVPYPNFGKVGITTNDFVIKKSIVIEFEDNTGNVVEENFKLLCGSLDHKGLKMRVLATNLSNDKNYSEFVAVYKLDNFPVYGLKTVYSENEEDSSLFIVKGDNFKDNNKIWKPMGKYEMLIAAAGFVKISDIGILWEPCDEYQDLYSDLVDVAGMG